eukprot:15482001-Alexandrium_andersonii.AAC.1
MLAQPAVGIVVLAPADQYVHVVQREALPKRDVLAQPAIGHVVPEEDVLVQHAVRLVVPVLAGLGVHVVLHEVVLALVVVDEVARAVQHTVLPRRH